jgi:hypothetical protein
MFSATHVPRRGVVSDASTFLTSDWDMPSIRKCSAKPQPRRGLLLQINYLINRTVEDGLYWGIPG